MACFVALGGMSQFPHLNSHKCSPSLIIISILINPDGPKTGTTEDVQGTGDGCSSIGSALGITCGVSASDRVVEPFSYLNSSGNSPGSTSSHVRLNNVHPSATIL